MKTQVLEITPEWATEQLNRLEKAVSEGTAIQRNVSRATVTKYANDMKNGWWGLTHQGIAFDPHGILVDGQHRLWAVKEAGVPVKMLVTEGLNGAVDNMRPMDLIDRGKARSIPNQLQLNGFANSVLMAACANQIAKVLIGVDRISLSFAQVRKVLDQFKDHLEAIILLSDSTRQRVSPVLAPLAIYHLNYPAKARGFAKAYFTLENLSKNDPPMVLHRWRHNGLITHGRDGVYKQLSITSNCIHNWHLGAQMEIAKPSDEARGWLASLDKDVAKHLRKLCKP